MHKIRLYPNQEQQQKIKQWIGTARWTYNRCVELVRKTPNASKKVLREHTINKGALQHAFAWALDTPYDVRDEAMADVLKAIKTSRALLKAGHIRHFKIGFRHKKKAQQESISIRKGHWSHARGVYAFLREIRCRDRRSSLPKVLEADSRLVRTRNNEYYLCTPVDVKVPPVQEQRPCSVVALDPGIRTFMTGYDPSGAVIEWGRNDIQRISRLCNALDLLCAKRDAKGTRGGFRLPHRTRYNMGRATTRIRMRIRALVDELHKKLSKWLCTSYSVILLPEFQTKAMIRRGRRGIGSRVARNMCTLSHYRFRQRLLDKSELYPHCRVLIVDEAYTSKTCGKCGHIHASLGANKIFRCPTCDFVSDRDANAARNILLRYLSSKQSPSGPCGLAPAH
ncbi:MAG: RNA-guided endonuclease InsQ/TnpB family protein [Ilumatobacteraceae bacterium]